MTMNTLIDKDSNEIRLVQVNRGIDYEERRAEAEGRAKNQLTRDDTIKKEVRNVRNSNRNQGKKHSRHYYSISIPKSYCRVFSISAKDCFVWDLTETEPLTFSLKRLNIGDNA
jgi:hypothetical protein